MTQVMLPPGDTVLHGPPDTILPMDLVAEVLARLPVKSILRYRCVCKSWNALISDPHFLKEQFRTSATDPARQHVIVAHFGPLSSHDLPINLIDYSLLLLFNSSSSSSPSQLNLPYELNNSCNFSVGSCHGMLCLAIHRSSPLLWNPSTRKFKNLPSLKWPDNARMECGFGHDHLSDSYKVVAVFIIYENTLGVGYETDVMVHTLGTDSWRKMIQKFPPNNNPIGLSGKFVSGTLNWLCVYNNNSSSLGHLPAIVSLDLGTEIYQQLLLPDCIAADAELRLKIDVLKGCLCIIARCNMSTADVWVMKDYGKNESWTKLLSVPCPQEIPVFYSVPGPLWISDEDDEILLNDRLKLAVYNSKSGTSKSHWILKSGRPIVAAVYAESLISP